MVDADQVSAGLIEVDEELMWCTSVDTVGNIVYVSLRGMYGTTAAAHTTASFVRNAPRFPRHAIKRAIQDTIRTLYPDVFAVSAIELTYNAATITYELPADVRQVFDVVQDTRQGNLFWQPVRRYSVNLNANVTTFETGNTIDFNEGLVPGATVNVFYKKEPTIPVNLTDDFANTGLTETARECVVYGACARMVGYLMPARFQNQAAQAALIDPNKNENDYLAMTRYFYQMHLQTKAEEARRLNELYPSRPHFTR